MKEDAGSEWVSFSDIMTGLMIIFLFISVSYMVEVDKKQKDVDDIYDEFIKTKENIYTELDSTFNKEFKEWDVILDKDLSIKFTNPQVLFSSGQSTLTQRFKFILNEFLPRYFGILLKQKYNGKIAEIRIEGHTDDVPAPQLDKDPYVANILLSQKRSSEVVKYLRRTDYFKNLNNSNKKEIEFLLTANGLSYGKTLDSNGNLTITTKKAINRTKSRRVEFRVVVSSDRVVDRILKMKNK